MQGAVEQFHGIEQVGNESGSRIWLKAVKVIR